MSSRARRWLPFALAIALVAVVWDARYLSGRERLDSSGVVRSSVPSGLETATFASGCFWCTESDFDDVPGVISTTAGYTGGTLAHPTYAQVSSGATGHVESVRIVFDPAVVSFDRLLDIYWHTVDPFNANGQFCDYGEQYRPVIFVHGPEQRARAAASRAQLQQRFAERIVVDIRDATAFYPADASHQNYSSANPIRYCLYRWGCGRAARLAAIWNSAS